MSVCNYRLYSNSVALKSNELLIDQFRYIKIQPNTIDLSTRPWGINPTNSAVIPQSFILPHTEVYCFRLNFNISKLVYLFGGTARLRCAKLN